jgi:uncharacterized membrane protein AbrB (regulator of aidB expression)
VRFISTFLPGKLKFCKKTPFVPRPCEVDCLLAVSTAIMQYLRVVLVAVVASVVALLFPYGGVNRFDGGYLPPFHLPDFAATAAVAIIGGGLGLASRLPAGVLLAPLALGSVLNVFGWVTIELPPVLLIASYALIGWNTVPSVA